MNTISVTERTELIHAIHEQVAQGGTLAQAVRRLRVEVTGLHQAQFARMCRISVRTLINLEQGEGNPTLKSLNAVFKPFGLQMGLMAVNRTR